MSESPQLTERPDDLNLPGAVVSIGNFDGVHHGHRQLLARMRALADELRAPTAVITFFPPSKVVFSGTSFLSTAEEKVRLLSAFRPDGVAVVPFSLEYSQTDKSVFLRQLAALEPAAIIVGEDFRFGYKRQGTLNDLSLVTPKLEVFGLQRISGDVVKSSAIRELLGLGEVEAAARLLGEPYLVLSYVRAEKTSSTPHFVSGSFTVHEKKAMPAGFFDVRGIIANDSARAVLEFPSRQASPHEGLLHFRESRLRSAPFEVRLLRKLADLEDVADAEDHQRLLTLALG